MARLSSRILSILLFGIASFSLVNAATPNTPRVVPGSYIVEFEDSDESPDIFFSDLSRNSIGVTRSLDLSYSLFKGASFQIDNVENEKTTLETIASLKNVKSISPNYIFTLPDEEMRAVGNGVATQDTSSRRLQADERPYAPHVMTGVDKLHEAGYRGKGIKVAIVDSGIDYKHPVLGGCFGDGCKVSFGYDLVGDDYEPEKTPEPDEDPYETCNGHGTHVAGILAGDMNEWGFTGVAPDVEIGMYKALSCTGRASSDLIIQAHMMAYEAGADIISTSLGLLNGWSEGWIAPPIQRIVDAGVPCSIANGNDGSRGVFSVNSPGTALGATSVASFQNSDIPIVFVDGTYEANGSTAVSFGWTPPNPPYFPNGTYPLYAISYNTTASDDACKPLSDDVPDLSEHIVLIRASTSCDVTYQMRNLAAKGVELIMFYSNSAGTRELTSSSESGPLAGMTTREQGEEWIRLLAEGVDIDIHITNPDSLKRRFAAVQNTDTGGYVSPFTAWGPTYEVDLKPVVGAPGAEILSTYPLELGGYSVNSGTSMACPFVSGVIALLLEARGKTDPATINNILSATADPNVYYDDKNVHPHLAPVMQQGGGLINAYDAIYAQTILSVSSISFNDTEYFETQKNFTIQNTGKEAVTYDLGHTGDLVVYTLQGTGTPTPYPFASGVAPEIVEDAVSLEFSSNSVTVAAGDSAVVTVSPTVPKDLIQERIPVYGGYITLNGTNGDSLSLPYVGVGSSMGNATILNTYLDVVYLGSTTGRIDPGHVFTLPPPNTEIAANDTSNYPKLWTGLGLGTRVLRVDIKPASPETSSLETVEVLGEDIVGSVVEFPQYYVSRLISDGMVWYGQMENGEYLPAGNYTLLIRGLKIFGDIDNPDDYELVETPKFEIRYRD